MKKKTKAHCAIMIGVGLVLQVMRGEWENAPSRGVDRRERYSGMYGPREL